MYRATVSLSLVMLIAAVPAAAGECNAVPLCSAPVVAEALRGGTVTLDGSATEGVPTLLEWFVTEPGDAVPVTPYTTGATADVVVTRSGRWSIGLRARYQHEAPGGGLYCDQTCVTVDVRSVIAALVDPGATVDVDEELTLDGTGSRWGAAVAPVMTWRVDGATHSSCGGMPASPSQVTCSVTGASLGLGSHTIELELRDPSNGDVDTDSVTVEVIDPPPQTADFTWSPVNPAPNQVMVVEATTDPPLALTELTRVTWSWNDGSPDETSWCPGLFVACTLSSHRYTAERRYIVAVTVETVEGEVVGALHGIEVGSAQLFSDGFEAGLSPAWSSGP
jgi:hypothetical protein